MSNVKGQALNLGTFDVRLSDVRLLAHARGSVALVAAILLIAAACSGTRVDAVLCRNVENYKPIQPTTRFSRDSESIYCAWEVKGGKGARAVRGVWYAEDVGKSATPDYRIDESIQDIDRHSKGWFRLRRPNQGWPPGRYRLEIYLDDRKADVLRFLID